MSLLGSLFSPPFLSTLSDRFVPETLQRDPERFRLARLHIRFGWMGLMVGVGYAAFYVVLEHYWGAATIFGGSCVLGLVPWLVWGTGRLKLSGHLMAAVLTVGFSGLGTIEGGLMGHAVGWLAAVPLMTLLLLGIRPALWWTVACVGVVTAFVVAHSAGIEFPKTFPKSSEMAIDAAGYIGLVPFLALLGSLFERTRLQASEQLQKALTELSDANQRLQRSNQDKDEFLNIAAHDLRNPLTGIVGYAALLKTPGESKDELIQEAGKNIESLALRMDGILTKLLDIRRIEEGQMAFQRERCSADEIMTEVINTFRQVAESKGITVDWQPDPAAPPFLGDRNATSQIFENLLSNALKYSQPGTTVRCVLATVGAEVRLQVKDAGPGLSAQDQKNLFKKFSRLTPKPTAGESSNGLGLWIVQKMAQGMGGDVRCVSAVGEGSTFRLVMPAAE
jgi:signal transduction histidine kinase